MLVSVEDMAHSFFPLLLLRDGCGSMLHPGLRRLSMVAFEQSAGTFLAEYRTVSKATAGIRKD